jgi:hypothetical protein
VPGFLTAQSSAIPANRKRSPVANVAQVTLLATFAVPC